MELCSSSRHRLRSRLPLGLVALLAMAGAHAQALRVTAANASNSAVYDVSFVGSGGYITTLNTDQNQYVSFRSLVFIANNATGKTDLLVADTLGGQIVRYANASGVATVVWNTTMGAGPTYPDGLSIDSSGDLFVVTSAPGSPKPAQLWVLPSDPSVPPGSGFLAPRLVDASFGGVPVQALEETLVARGTSAAAGAGDLLVLSSDPPTVFVYSAASIQGVLSGSGPTSPSRTLIAPAQFPNGAVPGGMDFWPIDGSLLLSTSGGSVLRYAFSASGATPLADFADGLGNGKFKVKAALQESVPYAFIANNNGGDILKFGAPPATGANPVLATVTSGVEHPQGLTASNLAATDAGNCLQSAGGCDIIGGVITHKVSGVQSLSGYVIEDPCVVEVDPRLAQYGTCTGHSLPVSQVCAGYGSTVIPDYLCGGGGNSGAGFALITSVSNTIDSIKGALVRNEAFVENILGGTNNPLCPQTVLGWAPLANEGTIVEGSSLLEMTGYCGSSAGVSKGLSLWAVGLVLNESALPGRSATDKLVNFAAAKYDALNQTVALATITSSFQATLSNCLGSSLYYFDKKKYANAAAQLLTCDSLVASNESAFSSSPTNPNPSGEIRGRIANLYLAINARILGNAPATSWPIQ